jgi:hypothetical protein
MLRVTGKDFKFLLDILESGPIFCRSRGKLLIIAAGHVSSLYIALHLHLTILASQHLVVIQFALECSVIRMLTKIYDVIVEEDTE